MDLKTVSAKLDSDVICFWCSQYGRRSVPSQHQTTSRRLQVSPRPDLVKLPNWQKIDCLDQKANLHHLDKPKSQTQKSLLHFYRSFHFTSILPWVFDHPRQTRCHHLCSSVCAGKIMRRVLRKIACNERDLGDISTLADCTVVEQLFQNRCSTAVWRPPASSQGGSDCSRTRQRPQTQPGKRKRKGRRNSTNSVLSNKQPLAPDEYCWCAAESVFKITPLSLYVTTDSSSSKRHNIWSLVRLPTPVEVVVTDFKCRDEWVIGWNVV